MSDAVTLVIPGRNCGATLEACLDAVIALRRNQRPSLVLTSLVMELADG